MIFIEEKFACKKKVRYEFTYLDYLYYYDRENWKRITNGIYPIYHDKEDVIDVAEDIVEYVFDNSKQEKTGDKKHDKIFKDVLQNREEIAQFINKFGEYKVNAEELEIYNPNYITEKFEYKNADIVYKIKDKLEESECEEDMSTIAERIVKELGDEKKAARAEGMMLGILQTIKQMIKMNLEDDLIKQATGAQKSEIEKIRKELNKE